MEPGADLSLTLYWRAESVMNTEYQVSVAVVAPNGRVMVQRDYPIIGPRFPTSAWRPGEAVRDTYLVSVPVAAAALNALTVGVSVHGRSPGRT